MVNIGIGVVKCGVEIQKVKLVGHRECIGTRIQVNLKWINFEKNVIKEELLFLAQKFKVVILQVSSNVYFLDKN